VNNENLALEDQISNDDFGIKTPKKTVYARTEKQKKYLEILKKNNIIYAIGPAGTGKTFLPVAVAVNKLISGEVKKIILSRPAVEAGESLGFLPGDLKDKIDPYLIPLYDSLSELIGHDKMNKKIEDGSIEIAPLAFMRGRTLKDSFVILDEAQNATETQIKMFLTRLGKNTTMVVNGDPTQIDLPSSKVSGLMNSANVLSNIEEIKIVKFDSTDVQRHPLVSKIIEAYKKNSLDV
jgi:phosphate starvation-inducible PhoH-like protein